MSESVMNICEMTTGAIGSDARSCCETGLEENLHKAGFSLWGVFLFFMLVGMIAASNAQAFDWLRSENGDVKEGNALLKKKDAAKALAQYDEAAKALPNRGEVHLNRALALSRLEEAKMDEAMQALTLAVDSDAPRPVLARAEFNLANAFFIKEDYKAAIEHYKKSLLLKPGNHDAAWNLEVAKLKKKQQEEQQKQNQDQQNQDGDSDDQQNQDQQDQDQQQSKGDQNQPDEKKQDDKKKEDEKKQDDAKKQSDEKKSPEEQKKEQESQSQQPEPQQAMPPQQQSMERMLNALDKEDNDFHKNKARQRAVGAPAHVKDW